MAKYKIEVSWDSIYEVEAEDRETAIEKAIEYFQECKPNVEIVSYDRTFVFCDEKTREDFFVEAHNARQAIIIAKEYFEKPICYGAVDLETAEALGYDTYS